MSQLVVVSVLYYIFFFEIQSDDPCDWWDSPWNFTHHFGRKIFFSQPPEAVANLRAVSPGYLSTYTPQNLTLKIDGLEDFIFLLGWSIFRGELLVSGRIVQLWRVLFWKSTWAPEKSCVLLMFQDLRLETTERMNEKLTSNRSNYCFFVSLSLSIHMSTIASQPPTQTYPHQ